MMNCVHPISDRMNKQSYWRCDKSQCLIHSVKVKTHLIDGNGAQFKTSTPFLNKCAEIIWGTTSMPFFFYFLLFTLSQVGTLKLQI